MAGNSVIGALRVDLGLNSAQFTEGMKQAQGTLGRFGVQLTYSLNGIAEKVGELIRAFPDAIKGAIDHAAALNLAAQKAGVTVEALSRLEFAAKFSDISLDQLTLDLGRLSKNMEDAATKTNGPVATAFKALGISVTDASGHLRSAGDVFTDLADRFSKMPDGATKTALAIQLLGKSGAQLIPLLNQGADKLREFAKQSDALGDTINDKTAKAAEEFNHTLTLLGDEFTGIVNQITIDLLPTLQNIADFFASPEVRAAISGFVKQTLSDLDQLVVAVKQVADFLGQVEAIASRLFNKDDKFGASGYTGADLNNAMTSLGVDLGAKLGPGMKYGASSSQLYTGFGFGKDGKLNVASQVTAPTIDTGPAVNSLKPLNQAIETTSNKVADLAKSIGDTLSGAIQGFVGEIEQGTSPLKAFADQLSNLANQLLSAGIQSLISSIFSPNFIGGTPGAPALRLGFQVGVPGRAAGGPVDLGQPYMVGEQGPELFVPSQKGTIVPNAAGRPAEVHVLVGVDQSGNLKAYVQQVAGQTANVVVSQTVPGMIKAGAPSAVLSAQRDNLLKKK